MVNYKQSEEAKKLVRYLFFVSGNPRFKGQVWGRGTNKDIMAVLMSGETRVREFRERHILQ